MAKRKTAASKTVASAMRRRKAGTLKSSSGTRVRSRKQAIAIGLSEARRKGADVPPPPDERTGRTTGRKTTAKRKTAKRTTARRSASKRSAATRRTSARTRSTGTRTRSARKR